MELSWRKARGHRRVSLSARRPGDLWFEGFRVWGLGHGCDKFVRMSVCVCIYIYVCVCVVLHLFLGAQGSRFIGCTCSGNQAGFRGWPVSPTPVRILSFIGLPPKFASSGWPASRLQFEDVVSDFYIGPEFQGS